MRKALNSNPLLQVGAIAALGVVVAFLMLTRLQGEDSPPPATTPAGTAPAPDASSAAATPTPGATTPAPATSAPTVPGAAPEAAEPVGDFVAGPGLPTKVVDAHERGDTVVILVTRAGGIDDAKLRQLSSRLGSEGGIAFFHAYARDIADYSRITQGVDVSRVPVAVALAPPDGNQAGPPVAAVSYGFRGYESLRQVARDAAYDGKQLPYHPK